MHYPCGQGDGDVDAMHRVLQATAAAFIWWGAFQCASAEHAVDVLLHMGILPLGQGPALDMKESCLGPGRVRLPYSGACGAHLWEKRDVGEIRNRGNLLGISGPFEPDENGLPYS